MTHDELSTWNHDLPVSSILGRTLVEVQKMDGDNPSILFTADDGSVFKMFHDQDCCERVDIDDINGDLNDLIGSPILKAESSSNKDDPKKGEYDDSWTWTFYHFATKKGYVTIRWYGSSNGYYSESVNFVGSISK